jgi:hypothetical protein
MTMNNAVRQRLSQVAQDIQMREILTFIYRDQPQGASFQDLKETLFLHDRFEEGALAALMNDRVLAFDGSRYKISTEARQALDRDPTILMDEFMRDGE